MVEVLGVATIDLATRLKEALDRAGVTSIQARNTDAFIGYRDGVFTIEHGLVK